MTRAGRLPLRGELVRVPSKVLPDGFEKADHPLYPVALAEWRGFVFVNLDGHAAPLKNFLGAVPELAAPSGAPVRWPR